MQDLRAEFGSQFANVAGQLVEHQRQGKRDVLALRAGVSGADSTGTQLGCRLLNHLPVGEALRDSTSVLLVHVLLPAVALVVGARGKRGD